MKHFLAPFCVVLVAASGLLLAAPVAAPLIQCESPVLGRSLHRLPGGNSNVVPDLACAPARPFTRVSAFAAEAKDDPPVVLPDVTPAPAPPPKPDPALPTVLAADAIYLIRANVNCTVIEGTEGLVKITALKGPVVFAHTKFTDSVGYETRTVSEPYVYFVEAIGKGPCDLIIIPDGGKPIRRKLDVGGVGPGPVPPIPPTPPTDPFAAAVQAAYTQDTDADKAKSAASLAALYRAAASLSGSSKFTTLAGVMAWIKGSEDIAATAIPNTRKAVGAELNKVLPTDPSKPLDADMRALIAKNFTRVAAALEGVK